MVVSAQQLSSAGAILAARLSISSNISALRKEVEAFASECWVPHVNRRDYQGSWSVLPLRCLNAHREAHPILQGFSHAIEGEWQDLANLTASPHLQSLLCQLKCPLKSVRLMKLAVGGKILPHRDKGLAWEFGEARLHLPLMTDPRVVFFVGDMAVPMLEGELWYMNADAEHSVQNHSESDRVHLVVDCQVNDWLRAAIQNAHSGTQAALSRSKS